MRPLRKNNFFKKTTSSKEPKRIKHEKINQLKKVWGTAPNKLLQKKFPKLMPGGFFLDLGCGQGRDSLFMLEKGFNVVAVDISQAGIDGIKKSIQEKNLPADKIDLYCEDILDFQIEQDKFSVINIHNSLQFLKKSDALTFIGLAKTNIKNKGHIIISGFTVDDFGFKKPSKKLLCYFEPQELKNLFSDFKILFYREEIIEDGGHPGFPEPHTHNVVKLIAQKI